jgi:curli biogenesis system outer membrane secretion channel CsgG
MKRLFFIAVATALVFGCGQKPAEKPPEKKVEAPGPNLTQTPDVGKLEAVPVTAKGIGTSPALAVNEALKSAILQVNGTTMSMSSSNINFGLDVAATNVTAGRASVTTKEGTSTVSGTAAEASLTSIRGNEFAEQIIQRSKGAVTEFKITETAGPDANGNYTVSIEAKIAKFKAPADAGKTKIVIAPLKTAKASFNFAGEQVPSKEVLAALRQQIVDALAQTGRFSILDREFAADIESELSMIASGQTPNADFAKLGQALSADLVWIGVVNDFNYAKHVRTLQTSDRELVSYSGGWSMSQRLVNVATKQISLSTTLQGKAPEIAPTTLGDGVNKSATLQAMQADIVKQATEAIVLRTFPISVVEREGNMVVLSQGGKALSEGARFKIFLQGKGIKDPQTGQSLGNMESMCCEVVVERVTPTLSYGRLENVKVPLEGVKPGALQVRESVPATQVAAKDNGSSGSQSAGADSSKPKSPQAKRTSGEEQGAEAASPVKSKDW